MIFLIIIYQVSEHSEEPCSGTEWGKTAMWMCNGRCSELCIASLLRKQKLMLSLGAGLWVCGFVVVSLFSGVLLFATPWLQHARPPCSSPSPRVYPSLCTLSQWCHQTISSSATLWAFCPQSIPASGSFPICWLFASGGQVLELQLQHQSF